MAPYIWLCMGSTMDFAGYKEKCTWSWKGTGGEVVNMGRGRGRNGGYNQNWLYVSMKFSKNWSNYFLKFVNNMDRMNKRLSWTSMDL